MLDFLATRIGKTSDAQTGPASISPVACNTVTPHARSPYWIARSSADGPRSPTIPGWTTSQQCWRQIVAGIARRR